MWTTGASVRRYDYWDGTEYDEVLSLEPGSVRLERLNLGAPYLDTHSSYSLQNVIGSVVPGSAKIEDGRGTCRVLLSRAEGDKDTVQKIRDGVIRNNSVGYWVHKVVKTEGGDGKVARWDVVDWEPLEISAVPIPADPGSQIRSEHGQGEGPQTRSCMLVTRTPATRPAPPASRSKPMATKAKTSAKRGVSKTEIEAEEERKRLAALRAAKRDDDKDEDGDADDDEQRDDDADGDDDKTADDERDGGDDDSSDDERDGGDDDDEEDGKDERAAPAGKRKAVTPAEMRKAAEAAVRADRIRGAKIREIGAQFGYPKLAERHANGETSVRDFKDIVLERLAKRQASRGNSTVAATGTPEIGGQASRGATPNARDFDKGAAEARALLGLK